MGDREDSWRKAGLPVLEEEALCPKIPHDWHQTWGSEACHEPAEVSYEQEAEDSLPCLWWRSEPHCRQREDRSCFPHRRTEDCYEGVEGPGQEGINLLFCSRNKSLDKV